jgi:hypothetical protein|tara:strand:- start:3449 stop:3700 length:252 start_codon:yes stop_codon:yes gene_type:complete
MDPQDEPLTFVPTDEIVRELHRRHPVMMLIFEKEPSSDDQSTLNIYGPDHTAAGLSRALGLLEAGKQQMQFDFLLMNRMHGRD